MNPYPRRNLCNRRFECCFATERTQKERCERIRQLYISTLTNIIGATLYISVCGVTYQLTTHGTIGGRALKFS